MKIIAFGATGFVGQSLVPHLASKGHSVTVVARSHIAASRFEGTTILQADPMKPGAWQEQIGAFDAVINLAGAPIMTPWNAAGKKQILESRVNTTRNIVDALKSPQTFLCANAVGYYGSRGNEILDDTATAGSGFLADVAKAWQAEAERARSKDCRVIIPRISVVLGKGGALAQMYRPFSLGLGGRIGDGKQWFSWIHAEDLVRAFTFLLESDGAGIFNMCAPQHVTNADFTAELGRALGRPTLFPVPAFALKLALGERASLLLDSLRCAPRRLQDLGFCFDYPSLDVALSHIVRIFRR